MSKLKRKCSLENLSVCCHRPVSLFLSVPVCFLLSHHLISEVFPLRNTQTLAKSLLKVDWLKLSISIAFVSGYWIMMSIFTRCLRFEVAVHGLISVWRQNTARAIRKRTEPPALISFAVLWCLAPVRMHRASSSRLIQNVILYTCVNLKGNWLHQITNSNSLKLQTLKNVNESDLRVCDLSVPIFFRATVHVSEMWLFTFHRFSCLSFIFVYFFKVANACTCLFCSCLCGLNTEQGAHWPDWSS